MRLLRPRDRRGPDQVRVRVRATAINRADLLQRMGMYPAPPDAPPDIPGLEIPTGVPIVYDLAPDMTIRSKRILGT